MAAEGGRSRAAFIDRDGVINEERGYVHRAEDFVLLPGAAHGLRELQDAGYLLVVISNQSGIGRGLYTESDYQALTEYMQRELAVHGIRLAAIEHCPHLPEALLPEYRGVCSCRKPAPGMVDRAARSLGIDLAQSVLVGDRLSDVQAGRAAGVGRCFLVRSGRPLTAEDVAGADGVYADLATCARELVRGGNCKT